MPYKNPEKKRIAARESARRCRRRRRTENITKARREDKKQRLLRRQNPRLNLMYEAKRRARVAGIEWKLGAPAEAVEMVDWPERCPILQVELNFFDQSKGRSNRPSLDRCNNSKGYIPGNAFIISRRANRLKSNLMREQVWHLYQYMSQRLKLPSPQPKPMTEWRFATPEEEAKIEAILGPPPIEPPDPNILIETGILEAFRDHPGPSGDAARAALARRKAN